MDTLLEQATSHRHGYEESAPEVERIEVVRVAFRRGNGCCEESPVRIVTAYYAQDGTKLAEVDPFSAILAVPR